MSNLDPFRAAGNPLFNDNKLKLGIFASNCSNACAMTLAETSFEPDLGAVRGVVGIEGGVVSGI
jgi:hypothetical protein